MRIDDKLQFQQSNTVDIKTRKASEKVVTTGVKSSLTASTTVATAKDDIKLSLASQSVTKIKQSLIDLPDVRAERVAELKAKIADGSYNPSSDAIATKIVNTAYSNLF